MRFETDWISGAQNASAEERATMCDFKFMIGAQNACEHIVSSTREFCDHLTMPVSHLAEGIAYNWWTIFGARDCRHDLISHRMGYAVPNIIFKFDGVAFDVSVAQHPYKNPDIRFWQISSEVLTRQEAERTLSEFVERVIGQLSKNDLNQTAVTLRWNRVRASLDNADEAAFCEAAGALRVDPYDIQEKDAIFIEQAGSIFSGEPLIEFLAGTRPAQDNNMETLRWIEQTLKRPGYQSALPELGHIAEEIDKQLPYAPGAPGWAKGYARAKKARSILNQNRSDKAFAFNSLVNSMGGRSFRTASYVKDVRALISLENGQRHIHLRNRSASKDARRSELFTLARAIGDVICFPYTPKSIVNDLHEANRQAVGRAFAAEFLAPIDKVASMIEDGYNTDDIADEFNVHSEVISRQIENKDHIFDTLR